MQRYKVECDDDMNPYHVKSSDGACVLYADAQSEIARLTAERDDWANKYNESCNTYSEMHVALEKAEYERDQALATNERWRRNSTETWEAMTAMRNEINQHIPMPSIESDLLQGPENSIFCASVAEAVINGIQARAAAAAGEMRGRAASVVPSAHILTGHMIRSISDIQAAICALPIDPDAQKALDKLLVKAREDAIREAAELFTHIEAYPVKSRILALLNDGGRDE